MPVTLPRRSSTSGSGSLYGSTTSSRTDSSTIGSSSYSHSYLDRASSLTKTYSPSSSASKYSPNYSSYLSSYSSYTPRSSTAYRSSPSSSGSSYLTGGATSLGSYRSTSSYASNNDTTTSSRYGLNKAKSKASDTLRKDGNSHEAKKPPSGSAADKRLSGSYSSSSLARLVATSGLDIYEKYSPAHYKPNCELSRSRSAVSEAAIATADESTPSSNESATPQVTLQRPRSRYSRLHQSVADGNNAHDSKSNSNNNSNNDTGIYSRPSHRNSGKLAHSSSANGGLSNSSSSSDVPTYTLRGNRLFKTKGGDEPQNNGGLKESSSSNNINGLDSIHNQLNDLKLSPSTSTAALNAEENSTRKSDVVAEIEEVADGNTNGNVSTAATLNLDSKAVSPQLSKSNKISFSRMRR